MLIPERERALVGIRRALKPGGKLAAIVFSSAEKNPPVAPYQVIARRAGLPPVPSEDAGLFALGDPGVLRAAYERAGFREVDISVVPTQRWFPSVAAAMQHRLDSNPDIAKLLANMNDAARDATLAEIEASVRRFEGEEGVGDPGEYLIGVGTK